MERPRTVSYLLWELLHQFQRQVIRAGLSFAAPDAKTPGQSEITAAYVEEDQVKAPNTVQGVNPPLQVSKFALFSDGRRIHNDLDDRWTPTASTQIRMKRAQSVDSHGTDQPPGVPLLMIQESADRSRRLAANMVEARQTQRGQETGQHDGERVLMLLALTCPKHVSIKVSSTVNLFRYNLNMRERDVLDKLLEN